MMSTKRIIPFATNLAIARRYAGLSMGDLAERIGVTKQSISKYENGVITPGVKTIYSLAEVLGIHFEDFFKEPDEENLFKKQLLIKDTSFKSIQQVKFREGESIHLDLIDRVKSRVLEKFRLYDEISSCLNYEIKFKNPIKNLKIESKKDAESAALKVRKAWSLGKNPLASVVSILENQGIRVIEVEEELDFQGLSAKIENIPIIVVNKSVEELTRKRFTTLHELGHLLLEVDEESLSIEAIERICDAFAGTMLMPKELLIIELGNHRSKISKQELVTIKEKYGISVRALLVSAAFCEIISWNDYRTIKIDHEFDSDFGEYYGDEKPRKFDQLLLRGLIEGKISRNKATELSGLSPAKIKEFEENYV